MSGFEIIEISETSPGEAPKETPDSHLNNNEKWQKLALYYLARLKGLCDWRSNSRSKTKQSPKTHLKRCSSEELESRMIDNITQKPSGRLSTKQSTLIANSDDIGCYLAAGYEEGKQQAVKIISRSLKYGVMTGILRKRGNCYRIAPEYLCEGSPALVDKKKNVSLQSKSCDKCFTRHKFSVKSVKSNVRNKDKKKSVKGRTSKHKITEAKKSKTMVKGKKRKCSSSNIAHVKKKRVHSKTSVKVKKGTKRIHEDNSSDDDSPKCKKNKRASDTNVNLSNSSNSNTSFQTLSRSLTPIDDRHKKRDVRAKRLRPKIQKPINHVPPLRRPRTKSQSKSPSHHSDDDEVKAKENNGRNKSRKVINQFSMPRPRRYSEVMSSISSSSCTTNDDEKYSRRTVKKSRRK